MKKAIEDLAAKVLVPTPPHLRRNQVRVGKDGIRSIESSLNENYHVGWRSPSNYTAEGFANDLRHHAFRRLEIDRRFIVPWLDGSRPLRGQNILEIGSGTGSSTVALAEQGAKVTGIDIDEGALQVAKDRCAAYGLDAQFMVMNAGELKSLPSEFDHIIFFASLEHMTLPERLSALSDAWALLPAGGQLTVADTPNRLWFFDSHTSRLPFFHWLPDDLAFYQSCRSSRENFREIYQELTPDSFEHFLRRGRGVSYHEFDAAIGPISDIKVASSLSGFWGARYRFRQPRLNRKYKALLRRAAPEVDPGFLDEDLYLVVEKQ